MKYYEVFGGVLQSQIDFPELHAVDARRPDWTLTRASSLTSLPVAVLLGEEELVGGVTARFVRGPDGYRLTFGDTGSFDLARDGSRIEFHATPNADPDVVRSDVLGRVLAVAMHAAGDLCLHGSAVAVDGRGIVLVGPKGYGKSTLAMALMSAGARFVADDTARLTTNPARVAAGVPLLRLRADTALHFDVDEESPRVGDKVIVRRLDNDDDEQHHWVPLAAVYVLVPRTTVSTASPVSRRRLSELEATLALVQHGKSAALLGKDEAATVLARASALAKSVPIFALDVARDLRVLGTAASRMAQWHSASRPLASSSSS